MPRKSRASLAFVLTMTLPVLPACGQGARPRARDLGVPFDGTPGPLNAITDVAGVEVGHTTLIAGEGKLEVGKGPVRTGVTAILPRGKDSTRPGLRRLVLAQRQRRDDRHDLDRGVGLPRRAGADHQHAQRRRRARRGHRLAREAGRRRHEHVQDLVVCCPSSPRPGTATSTTSTASTSRTEHVVRGARRRRGAGRSPRATSAAAPA